MHSFEIEGLEKMGEEFSGVVVGKILEIKKHPNAERLQIASVETRHGASLRVEELQIVCGAPNIEIGQKVPVALVGAKLPNGLEIKEAEIRGEKSFGMLCALDELGLGTDHSGIFILDKNAKVGEPLAKYLGLEDYLLEMKVLPDRAHDAFSHVGIAREISVLERKEFEYDFDGLVLPKNILHGVETRHGASLRVEIKDKNLCRRYIGAVMTNIEIKDSPDWMKARLRASGIRVINNVVDATNYVMLELGQPLHAFDANEIINSKIKNIEIVVRKAKRGEKMMLLDDKDVLLTENDLLITNGETPLALAGIKGGKDSGITENTKTLVLEAASFDATNVRRTRTRLNIKTDSSDRYEKDLDPNLTEKAMVRLIEILEHTASGELEEIVDVYPKKVNSWKIKLDLDYVNSLLGEVVPEKEVIRILNSLGIITKHETCLPDRQARSAKQKYISCIIPTFRIDLKTQEDLIEEIGRIWGYEKIVPAPLEEKILPAKINEQAFFERKLQDVFIGLEFSEVYNYSFYGEKDVLSSGEKTENHFELASPMNPEQKYVRTSLLPNLLKNICENLKHFKEFGIFEVGRTYTLTEKGAMQEKRMLSAAKVLEMEKENGETFLAIKGDVEDLLSAIGVSEEIVFSAAQKVSGVWHTSRTAEIMLDGKTIGVVGEIDPEILENYKIGKRVAILEFDATVLREIASVEKVYQSINRFPTVSRDVSMIFPKDVSYADIYGLVKKTGGELIENIELFDRFEAKNSLAIRISLNAKTRTLEGKEVDEVMNKIISILEKELRIEVRK